MKPIGIIGAGFAGLGVAYELAKMGRQVVVIAADGACASQVAQGVASIKGHFTADTPLFEAKILGHHYLREVIPEVESLVGETIPKDFSGVLETYEDAKGFKAIAGRVFRGKPWGLRLAHHYPGGGIGLGKECGYFKYFGDYWIDAPFYLDCLIKAIEAKGGRVVRGSVKGFFDAESGWTLRCRGHVECIVCDDLIICAGSATPELIAQYSLPQGRFVAGSVIRGSSRVAINGTFLFGGRTLRLGSNKFVYGASSFKDKRGLNPHDSELDLAQLKSHIADLLDPQEVTISSGTRLMFRDRMPVVGRLDPKLAKRSPLVISGLYKNGLHLGNLIGRHVAAGFAGIPYPPWLEAFTPRRFDGNGFGE